MFPEGCTNVCVCSIKGHIPTCVFGGVVRGRPAQMNLSNRSWGVRMRRRGLLTVHRGL